MFHTLKASLTAVAILGLVLSLHAADNLAADLRKLDTAVFSADAAKEKKLGGMVERDIRGRVHQAHLQEAATAFAQLKNRGDWERFRDQRIGALRKSLGSLPPLGQDLKTRVVSTYKGAGYERDNLVFESRPGLPVTANLYRPAQPPRSMPGLVFVHGFHQPKTSAELQDCGVNWAKLGCLVLVIDVLGHGERKQHPFTDASKYPGKFNVARQDYYSRANLGVPLDLAGESLMGWMVFDVLRGVDLLLQQPGIDKQRIMVLGAVAAGGDIAAVAGALDPRIAVTVPFNFGGPEPETVYPLPAADADLVMPYATGGHWDSTRRLRNAARDGFLPWLIVGSVAPRRLVYGHEFDWDKERDSVARRLGRIFELYGAGDKVGHVHGSGTLAAELAGKGKNNTGCANIGPVHRANLYGLFKVWFQMGVPDKETHDIKPPAQLICLTPAIAKEFAPRPVYQHAADLAHERSAAAHKRLAALKLDERRQALRRDWAALLGDVAVKAEPKLLESKHEKLGDIAVERIVLETEPGIVVPLVLLLPSRKGDARVPVVIGVAQHGKHEFLRQRSDAIADLLKGGVAVCLPDVRGTGETKCDGDHRGVPAGSYKGVAASSSSTLLANEDLMLGRTVLGDRLRDLRSVLRYLRTRPDLDMKRLALWGDSFAPVNGPGVRIDVPWDADKQPAQAEPLGGLLALFGALYEDDVRAVHVGGGLVSYVTLLQSPFCHVPHDAIVPGAMTVGDLSEVMAALAPRALRLQASIDGNNRKMTVDDIAKALQTAVQVYRTERAQDRLLLDGKETTAGWLLARLSN